MRLLPDNILRCISPSDRQALGRAGLTAEEARQHATLRIERGDHNGFINYCNLRGILFVHASPVRRSTIRVGWPDFSLFHSGGVLFLEFKVRPNTLTTDQAEVRRELETAGFRYHVALFTLRGNRSRRNASA